MPLVQDGRRQRTAFTVGLEGVPSGPVSRRIAGDDERKGFPSRRPAGGLQMATPRARPPVTPPSEPAAITEEEEPVPEDPEPTVEPSPPIDVAKAIRELAAAAAEAEEAWSDVQAAEIASLRAAERWELAGRALRRTWGAIDGRVDLGPIGKIAGLNGAEPASDHAFSMPPSAPIEAQPAGAEPSTDIPRIIPERPKPAAGGGPGARVRQANGLTRRQEEILKAVQSASGDRKAASVELATSVEVVEATLENIGKKGLLPIALIPKLPARYAKYTGVST